MHKEAFQESMKRVLAFYAKAKDGESEKALTEYLDALYEAVAWMDGYKFDEVTKQIVLELNPIKKPMASQFVAVYHKLGEKIGWDKPTTSGPEKISTETHIAWCIAEVRKMPPAGARAILKMIDAERVKFPNEAVVALLETAGKDAATPGKIEETIETGMPLV